MPKALKDFIDKLRAIWQWIMDTVNGLIEEIGELVDLRAIITEEFQEIIDDVKELTEESGDFAERLKTLKTKVIRADLIFQFLEELRTGELRDFFVIELQSIRDSATSSIEQALSDGEELGIIKPGSFGSTNPILKVVRAIINAFRDVAKIVHALRAVEPAVRRIKDKLLEFEDIVMRQDRPKVKVEDPGYHYTRTG